ncbi:hypothetical protein CEXT_529321 [Caerostris extrusa]|uniref:Uncharacterized protein n=1 Tax=Caerostris extrusa TaxID=172846 RepID=A0AAV4RVM2_CAEEX|nr:hypothetical protein CEXT_529321 [Caerostris extrusa]
MNKKINHFILFLDIPNPVIFKNLSLLSRTSIFHSGGIDHDVCHKSKYPILPEKRHRLKERVNSSIHPFHRIGNRVIPQTKTPSSAQGRNALSVRPLPPPLTDTEREQPSERDHWVKKEVGKILGCKDTRKKKRGRN